MANIGSLDYEITMKTEDALAGLSAVQSSIRELTSSAEKDGSKMDATIKQVDSQIQEATAALDQARRQNEAGIEELKRRYDELGKKIGESWSKGDDQAMMSLQQEQAALKPLIAAREKHAKEIEETGDALGEEGRKLDEIAEKSQKASAAHESFRNRLMTARNEMRQLAAAGDTTSERYRELSQEVINLTHSMKVCNAQTEILSGPHAGLTAAITAMNGLSGAMSSVQGVIGLFAGESENLQKVMLRVQSVMSISIGLQQAQNALLQTSAVRTRALAKVQAFFNGVVTAGSKALKGLGMSATAAKAAATALTATLTLGVSVAITAIVSLITKLSREASEAKKQAKEFAEAVASGASDDLAKLLELREGWQRLSTTAEKQQWIQDRKKDFDDLGVSIGNINDAENLLIRNTSNYVSAIVKRAEADAIRKKVQDTASEYVKAMEAYNAAPEDRPDEYVYDHEGIPVRIPGSHAKSDAQKRMDEATKSMEADVKRMAELQKEASALLNFGEDNGKGGSGSSSENVRTYKEELDAKKALYDEYNRWVTSSDETVRQAAGTQFESLLKEGKTYLDYLTGQRDALLAATGNGETATRKQTEMIRELNDAIAQETNGQALTEYRQALEAEIDAAGTLADKLAVLKERRDALAGDGSDSGKSAVIDEQQSRLMQQATETANRALEEYTNYLDSKIDNEKAYNAKMEALEQELSRTQDSAQRERIQGAMDFYRQIHAAGIDSIEDLDALYKDGLSHLKDYQRERKEINDRYDALIAAARIKNDEELAAKLEQDRQVDLLKATDEWSAFFDDLGDMSMETADAVKEYLEKTASDLLAAGKITAEQYKEIIQAIQSQAAKGTGTESTGQISGSVFQLLYGQGDLESKMGSITNLFGKIKSGASGAAGAVGSLSAGAGKASAALGIVDAIFQAIYGTLKQISDLINESANLLESFGHTNKADKLRDWADSISIVNEGVMSSWNKLKSGDVMGSLTDAIKMPMQLVEQINKIHDKKIVKKIQAQARAVRDLTQAYQELEWQVDSALGQDYYELQLEELENLRQQNEKIEKEIELENKKKKKDRDTIDDLNQQIKENEMTMSDTLARIEEDVLQTTALQFSDTLADGIANLFEEGFSASGLKKKSEELAEQLMANAVKHALAVKLVQKPMQALLDQMYSMMGFDENGNGEFNGLSEQEQAAIKAKMSTISQTYADALKMYSDLFDEVSGTDTTTLSGAIKGASQESIDLLAGQTNAVRVNQVEMLSILRDQLLRLSSIDSHAGGIETATQRIYEYMTGAASKGENLRAVGIVRLK